MSELKSVIVSSPGEVPIGLRKRPKSPAPDVGRQEAAVVGWRQFMTDYMKIGTPGRAEPEKNVRFKTHDILRSPQKNVIAETTAARAHIVAQRAREQVANTRLGARAKDYQRLADTLRGDPLARDALLRLLLSGKLTKPSGAKGEMDLLEQLVALNKQVLEPGVSRAELIRSLLIEINDPTNLRQQDRLTCATVVASVVLIRKNPVEYVRLVAGLASLSGSVKTVSGTVLRRNSDWANKNDGGRTPSVRLLQPALMDVGNFFLNYDNRFDRHTLGKPHVSDVKPSPWRRWTATRNPMVGLTQPGMAKILAETTGQQYRSTYVLSSLNRDSIWRNIETALASGDSVPCLLAWKGSGHFVLLDRIENGHCYFSNPSGTQDRMSVEEFRQILRGASWPRA